MAWEWVAPIATATVGVAGIFGTWLNGSRTLTQAQSLANEGRRQQRLENAYVDVLAMTETAGHWGQISYPLFDSNPPAPVPPLPTLEAQAHAEALVKAFGSEEVLALLEAWRKVIQEMLKCDRLIRMGLEHDIEKNPRATFMELQSQEREARDAIGSRVALELGHRKGTG